MFAISILAVGLSVALLFSFLRPNPKILRNGHPLRRPPNTLPLAGNGILFLQSRHKLFSWFVKCERIFGRETFQISVPSLPPGVVISDPKNLEYVMKNEAIFGKGDFVKSRSWDLFGNGIINADGDLWKAQRKAGLHFLNASNLKILTDTALPHYLSTAIEDLQSKELDQIVDLEHVFLELTTQLMGQIAYGMEMHADDAFSVAFDYASGATGDRFQNPLWQITEKWSGRRFRNALGIVQDFGRIIVATAVENLDSKKSNSEEVSQGVESISGSLINSLLDSIPDHQVVADSALNYLSAGRDTTAEALTWVFYLLMRHPDELAKIRQELQPLSKQGSDVFGSLLPTLDASSLRPTNLPYTMAVFYETLRLYPPVPFEIKQCESATTLPDGTFLPKTSVMLWCTWAMNRSKITWGSDADDFRPERWLEDGKLISKTAYEFPVFNAGPRTCLGIKMAENIAAMVITKLAWEFEFAAVESGERVSRNSLTLPMKGGLPVFVRGRTR